MQVSGSERLRESVLVGHDHHAAALADDAAVDTATWYAPKLKEHTAIQETPPYPSTGQTSHWPCRCIDQSQLGAVVMQLALFEVVRRPLLVASACVCK
jgi:hypothetical protein